MKCSLTIFGQVPGKKNSKRIATNRRTNKPFIISSKQALDWKEQASYQLFGKDMPMIFNKCRMKLEFYNRDKRRHDLDNMAATVLDFLVEQDIIDDDDCDHVEELKLSFGGVCKEAPRVIVEIEGVA